MFKVIKIFDFFNLIFEFCISIINAIKSSNAVLIKLFVVEAKILNYCVHNIVALMVNFFKHNKLKTIP